MLCLASSASNDLLEEYLMMPVKVPAKGSVLMHSSLAEARRGLIFVILAMTMLPGSGSFARDAPRSTSTVGFCKHSESN